MKKLLYLLSILAVFSCSCLESRSPASQLLPESTFPDKELEEIIVIGWYSPENQKDIEELKEELLRRPKCKEDSTEPERCGLVSGETVEEAIKNRYPNIGKEQFGYSGKSYCYNKTNDKEAPFNQNLKVRLYDKEGKMLTEDILRTESDDEFHRTVISYLPYHDEGHEIRIIRLERGKEIIIESLAFASQSELVKSTFVNTIKNRRDGAFVFDEETKCHLAPYPR